MCLPVAHIVVGAVVSRRRAYGDPERARILNRIADAIRADADDLAYIEALESGKPIAQAHDEMISSADLWEYAATLCRHTYGDTYNTLGQLLRQKGDVEGSKAVFAKGEQVKQAKEAELGRMLEKKDPGK